MSDLYQDLGVPKTATADEIKKAYREAAFKYHPDRNAGDAIAEEKFKKINAAYSVLGDETKRAQYDRYGADTTNPYGAQANYGQNYGNTSYGYTDPFEEFFRAARQAQQEQYQQQARYSTNANNNAQQNYTHYYQYSKKTRVTRREALTQIVRNGLLIGFGLFVLPWGIVGFMIGLSMLVNGVSGLIRALQYLTTVKRDK